MSTERLFFNKLVTKSLILSKENETDRFFTGILTVQMKDKQGEILIVEELMKVLPIWMKRGAPISDTHSNRIIGKGINYSRVKVKDRAGHIYHGVEITGLIYKDYKLDDDIWQKMKSGTYRGLSFGGATKSDREPVEWSDGSIAYNLKDLEHYEVAVCRDPAVPLALFTNIHAIAKSSKQIQYTKKGEDLICIQCNNVGCFVEKRIDKIDTITIQEQIKKGLIDITKPFAGYKNFDACIAANKDKGDAQAYCATIMRAVEGKEKTSVTLDPTEEDLTPGAHAISPTGKGLVEDHGDEKCEHCGYTPSSGKEDMQQHMANSHPDKLEDLGMHEVEKDPEDKNLEDEKEGDGKTNDSQLPQPGEEQQTHQETADDSGIIHPTKDPMYDQFPERTGDLMIETPTADLTQGLQAPETSPTMYAGGSNPDDQPRDQANTEGEVAGANGGSGQANSNISNDKEPNTYDHTGTGRDTFRNEDQNLKPDNAGNEDPESERPKSVEEQEVDERPKDTIKSDLFTLVELGYVETKTPRQCQTCEYFTFPTKCSKTAQPVDPVNGCCNYWDPEKKLADDRLNITKSPIVVSGHKQYANPQPDTAQISGSTDTVYDPNTEDSTMNPKLENTGRMGTFKSFINLLENLEARLNKESVPKKDAIKWWNIMNPSQRQHALDPNNWYTWSDELARNNYEELDEEQKRLVFSTYVFRNDGKTVEGADVEQLVPESEGSPQTEGVGVHKWFPENNPDTRNINATPEPMQVGQNTERPNRSEQMDELEKNLKILELTQKLKNVNKHV